MLGWTLTFLCAALLAALLGFADLASTAAAIARALFIGFVILFLLSLIWGRTRF